MTQRPFTVPIAHHLTHLQRFGQRMSHREIPHQDHALHRPHPRRYLLHALLTPMPWRLDIHHLFARTEQYFYRPPPSKLSHYPVGTRLEIGRKQITIIHPALEVPHYHDLDRTQPQHSRPDRLVPDHRLAATLSV